VPAPDVFSYEAQIIKDEIKISEMRDIMEIDDAWDNEFIA